MHFRSETCIFGANICILLWRWSCGAVWEASNSSSTSSGMRSLTARASSLTWNSSAQTLHSIELNTAFFSADPRLKSIQSGISSKNAVVYTKNTLFDKNYWNHLSTSDDTFFGRKHVEYIVLKTHVLVCSGNASEYFTIFSKLIEYDNAFNY